MSQLKKGAILSYLNIILTTVLGLLITPFIIRSLGKSEYGLYNLIGSFIAYLSLMDLGLNNTIVRFVSRYRALRDTKSEQKFLGTTMSIYFVISLLVVLIGLILYTNLDKIFSRSLNPDEMAEAKVMFIILIFNLAISLPGGAFNAICNAYEHFVFPRAAAIIRHLLRALTVVAVLNLGGKAISMVIIDTVFNIILILVTLSYSFLKLQVKFNFTEHESNIIKQIFSYSIWILLLAITSQFLWNAGQLILGIVTNTEVVAIYAVGIMLGGFYGSFSTAVSSLFLPRASQMSIHNTKEEILEMMIKIGRIFVLTGFISLGKDFIELWVGNEYYQSWIIALIMMVVYTVPLIQNFANSLVEAYNKVAVKVKIYLLCFSLGLLLGYFLIVRFQAIGIMIGIGIGWTMAQICMNYFFHNTLNLNVLFFFSRVFKKIIFPVSLLCLLLGLSNLVFPLSWWSLIIRVVIYSLLYWGVLYTFSMNEFEKQLIKIKIGRK